MTKETAPVRKCTICGETHPQNSLIRYAIVEGKVYPDFKQKLQGRGLYTCYDKKCIKSFTARKKLDNRFFDGEATFALNCEQIIKAALVNIVDSMKYFSSLSVKSGLTAKGQNTVQDLLSAGFKDFAFILIASDIAQNTFEKLERSVEQISVVKKTFFSKSDLGQFFSTRPIGVVGLKRSSISERISDCVELFNNLNEENSRC